MRIIYQVDEVELEGQARDLTTLGTFVVTDRPHDDGEFQLTLDTGSDKLQLAGEVVRVTDQGFAVAFHSLAPTTLTKLDSAIHGTPAGEPEQAPGIPTEETFEIQGEDWSPPVIEMALPEWSPDSDLIRPPPADGPKSGWEVLSTLSPTIEPPPEEKVQKRRDVRHESSIPVAFDNLTSLIKEFTHNISYGGMFVFTPEVLPKDSETAITLIHPVHGKRMTLTAKVVHSSQAPTPDPNTGSKRFGVGLEFRMPREDLKRVMAAFIG